jgi:hypothetical protein
VIGLTKAETKKNKNEKDMDGLRLERSSINLYTFALKKGPKG